MTRNIFIFLGTFVAGAVIALITRTALFTPHTGATTLASNSIAAASHVAHAAATETPNSKPQTPNPNSLPVNSVCAICGMDVDPKIPTAQYQGKTIGFGCKMCPPKFKADPDRYGPLYLRNEVAPK
jgi:hypothetical protein